MAILGLGIDVVAISRFEEATERSPGFVERVFTESERDRSVSSLAARWAAKEAVFRCLGTTWKRGTNWTDVEVVSDAGSVEVVVTGPTRELMTVRGVSQIILSTAHCRNFATATAIARM